MTHHVKFALTLAILLASSAKAALAGVGSIQVLPLAAAISQVASEDDADKEEKARYLIDKEITSSIIVREEGPLTAEERSKVTRLSLMYHDMHAVRLLASGKMGLTGLTELRFDRSDFTDEMMAELTKPDTALSNLRILSIGMTKLSEVGLRSLSDPKSGLKNLTEVTLGKCWVPAEAISVLSRPDSGLTSLKKLWFFELKEPDATIKLLSRADTRLKSLTSLGVGFSKVTDEGLKQLARADTGLSRIEELNLVGTKITDSGIIDLARPSTGLRELRSLFFGGGERNCTVASLKALSEPDSGVSKLDTLHVMGVGVVDEGLKFLARPDSGLRNLKKLWLPAGDLTDDGLMAVAGPESGLRSLEQVILLVAMRAPNLTSKGVDALTARYPKSIVIGGHGLTDKREPLTKEQAARNIIEEAVRNVLLRPSDEPLTPEDFASVRSLRNFNRAVTDTTLQLLASKEIGLTGLESIELSRDDAAEMAMRLSGEKANDAGMQAFASEDTNLSSLKRLVLGMGLATDEAVRIISQETTGLKNLTELSLYGKGITDESLIALAQPNSGLTSLRRLSLSWFSSTVTDKGIEAICRPESGLKSLTHLTIPGQRITSKGLSVLASQDSGLRSLESLNISRGPWSRDTDCADIFREGSSLDTLKSLELDGVDDRIIAQLCQAKNGFKNLKSLRLQGTMKAEGVSSLTQADNGLALIEDLGLQGVHPVDAAILALADSNSKLKSLKSVRIPDWTLSNSYLSQNIGAALQALRARFPDIQVWY